MTTSDSQLIPITIEAGVQPSTDKSAMATTHYTFADKIRFRFGMPQKIGGWSAALFSQSATISGKARALFGAIVGTQILSIIGTNSKLYSLFG